MQFFLISFVLMMLAVACMAVGVLCGRRAIKGSCGGLNKVNSATGLDGGCEICGRQTPCDDAAGKAAPQSDKPSAG